MPFFLEEMGWVEIYEYDLGFCNLHILIEVHPNENDFDDRYRMAAYFFNLKKKKKKKKKKKTICRGINLWRNNTYVEISEFVHSIQNLLPKNWSKRGRH